MQAQRAVKRLDAGEEPRLQIDEDELAAALLGLLQLGVLREHFSELQLDELALTEIRFDRSATFFDDARDDAILALLEFDLENPPQWIAVASLAQLPQAARS